MMDEQMRLLHVCLLRIMKEVHEICIKNNIRYSLAGGSLIGAMRHKGFIPWDDDIDIMMPYDDYKRFVDIVFTQEHEWLEFKTVGRTPNFYRTILKAYDKRTTLIQTDNSHPEGVFIDIFPFVCGGNNKKTCLIEYYKYRIIKGLIQRKSNVYANKNRIKEFVLTSISKVLPISFLVSIIYRQCERLSKLHTKYSFDPEGKPNGIVLTEYLDGFMEADFEGNTFMRLIRADEYLCSVFGDYMQMPPSDKRKPHHLAYFNPNLPYCKYYSQNHL